MDFCDERYVRLYVRDTKTWRTLGWEGQAVLSLLLRRFDRAGFLDDVRSGEDVAIMIGYGFPEEVAKTGLSKLLDRGVFQLVGTGLFMPNFAPAQEAAQSDKARARTSRERRRDKAKLDLMSMSQNVTPRHKTNENVTRCHTASQPVTPCLAVPSRTVPDLEPGVTTRFGVGDTVGIQEELSFPPSSSTDLTSETETKKRRDRRRAREAKGARTWEAYSTAYELRYGREPRRNAKASTLCVTLVDLLGADTAPEVAGYYPTTRAQPYNGAGHPLTLLVRDAQKLCTEWETGRRITQTQARSDDALQGTGDVWRDVIEEKAR